MVKMLLESSIWRSTMCSLTWKEKATKQGRSYYQLAVSARRTAATASPLLPTVTASLATHGGPNQRDSSGRPGLQMAAMMWATPNTMDYLPPRSPEALLRQATTSRKGRSRPANLREQVDIATMTMWPTPTADDAKDKTQINPIMTRNGTIRHLNKQGGQSCAGLSAVAKLWPTPTSRDYKDGTAKACRNVPVNGLLGRAVHMWSTPQAGDYRSPNINPGARSTSEQLPQSAHSLPTQAGGQLNPAWVSRLMGFPDGWLDL